MKYFCILFLLSPLLAFSQTSFTISGTVKDAFGNAVPYADINLSTENKHAVSDENGHFIFKNIKAGVYTLKTNAVGFNTNTRTVEILKSLSLEIVIKSTLEALNDVVVYGKTEVEKQEEKAITINSFDIKKQQNQSIGTEEVLKAGVGIIIRQSGGLGSDTNINLNGLSGNAIRIYYDGIPLDALGGLRLNAIPVDALERVDIYKGVIPIDIGTDALGGGINLVPLKHNKEYLRASYSVGSFNTHRVTFNGLKKINSKMSLSTISYLNYSDNDYKMKNTPNIVEIESIDPLNGRSFIEEEEEFITARRFHDKHVSGFIEAKLRIENLNWADRLELAASYLGNKNEIQHGAIISSTSAIGEAEVENNTFIQRIDYHKTFFNEKLKTRYYGLLSHAFNKVNDSTVNSYNWRGEILNRENPNGAEISVPTLLNRNSLATAHRLTLNYKLTDHLSFKASNFYKYTRTKGEDLAIPVENLPVINNESIDLNTIPSTVNQNIFGAALATNFFDDKLDATIFFKNYDFKTEAVDFSQRSATILPIREVKNNTNGYGFAIKYQIHPNIFVRTSVEQATRIPTESEIFGNFNVIIPNFELEVEESLNWNVGAQFKKRFKNEKSISLNVNGFTRNQENLIRLNQLGESPFFRFINEALVVNKGIELSLKIAPLKKLLIKANYTTQINEFDSGISEGDRIPNIPQEFYNLGGNYTIENVFKSGNNLEFFWTYFFTETYTILTTPDSVTPDPNSFIPKQNIHNTGLTYILKDKGLAFSFNLNNVFNTEVFDNFRIPRPGINYAFKINYKL